MRFRTSNILLAVTVVAVLSAGCSGSDGPSHVTTGPSDSPWSNQAPDLVEKYGPSPLSAYDLQPEDAQTLVDSQEVLIAQCMADRGFTYETRPWTVSADPTPRWDLFLGLTDGAEAQERGYQTRNAEDFAAEMARAEEEASANLNMSPDQVAYNQALYGPRDTEIMLGRNPGETLTDADRNACEPWAWRQITPDGPVPDLEVSGKLAMQASSLAEADSKVQRAVIAWSACMANSGYVLDRIPQPSPDPSGATPEAVKQAVADVGCKNSSGLTDTYITTLYAAEQAQVDSHQTELQAATDYINRRIRIAADVLAGP